MKSNVAVLATSSLIGGSKPRQHIVVGNLFAGHIFKGAVVIPACRKEAIL